jgi:hypothetical protein
MFPLQEVDVLGVFVTPAVLCLLAALPVSLGLRRHPPATMACPCNKVAAGLCVRPVTER